MKTSFDSTGRGVSQIPQGQIRSFLNSIPTDVRPFAAHEDKAVRQIRLRHIYEATVGGINYLIRLLEGCAIQDRKLLIGFFVGLDTSLHSFLAQNQTIRSTVSWLLESVHDAIDTDAGEADFDLGLLCDLHFATPYLPSWQRAWVEPLLAEARDSLRTHRNRYQARHRRAIKRAWRISAEAPVRARRIQWDRRLLEVLDQRHAEVLGLALDNEAYYSATVRELKTVPFRSESALDLFNLLTHTSYGLSLWHRRSTYRDKTASYLARHGLSYLDWLLTTGIYGEDPEILAGFADAFLKGGHLAWNSTSHLGRILQVILDFQLPDGGWVTNSIEAQSGTITDLYSHYHTVWVCVDALRPLHADLSNPWNSRLSLI